MEVVSSHNRAKRKKLQTNRSLCRRDSCVRKRQKLFSIIDLSDWGVCASSIQLILAV